MIDGMILLAYGGCATASAFMILSFARSVRTERRYAAVDGTPLWKCHPFRLAVFLTMAAIGLFVMSLVRAVDGLSGHSVGGSWPLGVLVSLLLLWGAFTGFHWAATMQRPRWHWRLYLLLLALWIGLLVVPYLLD